MSAVALGLVVLGTIVPYAGPAQVFAVVPFGIVAHRHRTRAVVASAVAGSLLAVLVLGSAGTGALVQVALIGGYVGVLKRRRWRFASVCASTLVLAPLLAGLVDLLLWAIASYRRLVFATVHNTVSGLASVLSHLGPLREVGQRLEHLTAVLIAHWPISIAAFVVLITPVWVVGAWLLLGQVLNRLRWVGGGELLGGLPIPRPSEEPPAPVPVSLQAVTVRYGETVALDRVDLELPVGQFVGLVGDNGSGKTTLAHLLAGVPPSEGEVRRNGAVGLGQPGGTALIGQRPDAQVVGLHAAEDIVWGLGDDHGVDVEDLLEAVGLAGMGDHPTSALSGGQLQRLAVAAALARRPRLLISDESTAMIDPVGRAELVGVLSGLPRRWPMSVVHITHNVAELEAADRIIRLDHGRVVDDTKLAPQTGSLEAAGPSTAAGRVVPESPATQMPGAPATGGASGLVLDGVGHSYGHGTVWQHDALQDISFSVPAGEAVLLVGPNGSGKSTLAWVIAGLMRPTHGSCRLNGRETRYRRGDVALAFQHARLQLQRPTVRADIADAAGWLIHAGRDARREQLRGELRRPVTDALAAVGLEPELAPRSIEELSGGQQRRVAIAGLLARKPAVLVLDEPLAGLDVPTRSALIELLAELRSTTGLTLIVVTHDPEPLMGLAPRVLTLDHGRVIADSQDPARAKPRLVQVA